MKPKSEIIIEMLLDKLVQVPARDSLTFREDFQEAISPIISDYVIQTETRIAELKGMLFMCVNAIESLEEDDLGYTSDGYNEWPCRDELARNVRMYLEQKEKLPRTFITRRKHEKDHEADSEVTG